MVLAQQNNSKGNDDNDNITPNQQYTGDKRLTLPPMDYPDTVAAVFQYSARGRFAWWAPFIRNFCSTTLVLTYYGVNIIYVCIVAATCKQIVDQNTANGADDSWTQFVHGQSIRWYPAVAALLIVPVGMIRLIKYIVPFSIAANTCLLTGVGIVFYYIVVGDDRPGPTGPDDRAQALVWPAVRWSLFAGSTLCSLEGIGMLLHIENAMHHPLELAGPPAYTLHKSMFIIVILNSVLGLCGYLRYGDKCQGSISLNLPANNQMANVIKIIIALGILLTYGLQLTVTADLAWQGLRRRLMKNAGKEEVNDEDNEEFSPRMTAYYYGMRFFLILGTILVATAVPDIGPLVSLVGSVGFSVLGLILPVLTETVWHWCPKDDGDDDDDEDGQGDRCGGNDGAAVPAHNGVCGAAETTGAGQKKTTTIGRRAVRHVKNVLLFVLGVFALVGGAYCNVRDIVVLSGGGDSID